MKTKIIKTLIAGGCFFLVVSILELIVADFDFFLYFLGFQIIGTIVCMIIFYCRLDNISVSISIPDNHSEEKITPVKKELIHKDFDVREVNFNIPEYNSNWFDYDIFHRDIFNVSIYFHSDNFDNTGLPADFCASKYSFETFMNGDYYNWFFIQLDSHGVGHGHEAPENQALEDFLLHNSNKKLKGIYDCTFKVMDYKTLMEICGEIASLSNKTNITKHVSSNKENLNDFAAKLSNMPDIPQELANYFSNDFIKEITDIKCKWDDMDSFSRTVYDSALIVKNFGEPIFYVELNPKSMSIQICD